MRKALLLLAILAGVFVITAHAPAHAQLNRTWVASNGSDGANCDRLTPCATFTGAYNKTAAGGEISCADSGNFGGASIAHSLTIDCESVASTALNASNPAAFVVTVSASDVVTLRGLYMDGFDLCGPNGALIILLNGAGTLNLEKMTIRNCDHGVHFTPSGVAQLRIADSDITGNGRFSSQLVAGVYIRPYNGATASVSIERSRVHNNKFGIFADGTGGGIIRGIIADSFVNGNINNGISVNTNGANVGLMVDDAKVSGNNIGFAVGGTNGLILVRRSTITANNIGLSAGGGGSLVTYKDNVLNNNTTDGAFSFALGTQ